MSAESAFREHCGPGIEFISTELFDHDRRRDFTFSYKGKIRSVGVKVSDDGGSDYLHGKRAALMTKGRVNV